MFPGVGARPLVQFHFLNEQALPLREERGVYQLSLPLAIEIAYPFN